MSRSGTILLSVLNKDLEKVMVQTYRITGRLVSAMSIKYKVV